MWLVVNLRTDMLLGFIIMLPLGKQVLGAINEVLEDISTCTPQLADMCFLNFSSHLINPDNIRGFDPTEFCSYAQDSFNCAQDIIDSDCTLENGRDTFDMWMKGMFSVLYYLCDSSPTSLSVLQKDIRQGCWNFGEFMDCIKQKTSVTHVLDMLRVILDINECNWLMISYSTCNIKATDISRCHTSNGGSITQDIINEVAHIFLQATKCTVCSGTTTYFIPNLLLPLAFVISILLK